MTTSPKKAIVGKSSVVRMPAEMKNTVIDFLKTTEAQALGFDSISDVVTASVRLLLEKYDFYEKQKF